MNTNFVLFLDVDGVLHPARWGVPGITPEAARAMSSEDFQLYAALGGYRAVPEGPLFSCLVQFEAAIRPFLDQLQIVISSSWRTKSELYEAILAAMSPDVRTRVAGVTPKRSSYYGRPAEINQWFRQHRDLECPAIVLDDDDTHDWRYLDRRALLFLVNTEQGFIEEDSRCLAKLLSLDPKAFAAVQQDLPTPCWREVLMSWADGSR